MPVWVRGPKVQMSFSELFWNNPLKLNWISASFEIQIHQGCLILITTPHPGEESMLWGPAAARRQAVKKSSCQSHTSSRALFLSILSAGQLGTKAQRGEMYAEIQSRRKLACAQLCYCKGNNIFWCYLGEWNINLKQNTLHVWQQKLLEPSYQRQSIPLYPLKRQCPLFILPLLCHWIAIWKGLVEFTE